MRRAGDDEGTVPVLPEAMVTRVAELSTATAMEVHKSKNKLIQTNILRNGNDFSDGWVPLPG